MDPYEMGQISQAWAVLEASGAPVEDSWYAGRDVGAVGFYTGVRVFDTAGLVTRTVSRSTAWAARGEVPDELLARMMEKQPLAADIFDGWDRALGKHPRYLATYRIRMGGPDAPTGIVAIDRSRPGREEILRRYRAFVAKLPRLYHLATLYGESMGAAAVRRLRVVEGGPI
jgi:hypothetical protein